MNGGMYNVIQRAAAELPECFTIRIEIMNGYGGVVLENPQLDDTDFNDGDNDLERQVSMAIDRAKELAS